MDYIVNREEIIINEQEIYHKLVIFKKSDNSILAESNSIQISDGYPNLELRIKYDDIEFVSINNEILITLESILQKFKKHEKV